MDTTTNVKDTSQDLLIVAKQFVGQHLTLDNSVPIDKGCAECWSAIAKTANISLPKNGIAGTATLLNWLLFNPDFQEVFYDPETQTQPDLTGLTIISATGSGNGKAEGHVGILGGLGVQYVNDYGILSNDSDTGTLREHWKLADWIAFYEVYGGMKARFFKYIGV